MTVQHRAPRLLKPHSVSNPLKTLIERTSNKTSPTDTFLDMSVHSVSKEAEAVRTTVGTVNIAFGISTWNGT